MADLNSYTFHDGPLPGDYTLDFEPALFNTPAFMSLQDPTRWLELHVLDRRRKKVAATVLFRQEGEIAWSPMKAPFGSVDYGDSVTPGLLFDFLSFIESTLRAHRVREVYLKNPPRIYDPSRLAVLETILLNLKYVVSDAEVGAVIPISPRPFVECITPSEVLRCRQGHSAGLTFSVLPAEDVASVFEFIAAWHQRKGYTRSIGGESLRDAVAQFPERYILCAVRDAERMVAASVSVRVKEKILYNFLVNHDDTYNHLSPPVLLMEGIYEYCSRNGCALFDLGTSALHGLPNFSLLDFKLRMGGLPTSKFTFYKKIS